MAYRKQVIFSQFRPFESIHVQHFAEFFRAERQEWVEGDGKVGNQLQGNVEDKSITLSIKAGEGGKAFGSVSSKEIAKAIKDQLNLDIDKKKLVLPEPIKTFGTHEVPIKLHKEVTGKLAVKVVEA